MAVHDDLRAWVSRELDAMIGEWRESGGQGFTSSVTLIARLRAASEQKLATLVERNLRYRVHAGELVEMGVDCYALAPPPQVADHNWGNVEADRTVLMGIILIGAQTLGRAPNGTAWTEIFDSSVHWIRRSRVLRSDRDQLLTAIWLTCRQLEGRDMAQEEKLYACAREVSSVKPAYWGRIPRNWRRGSWRLVPSVLYKVQ
jgi:hypothetical protein